MSPGNRPDGEPASGVPTTTAAGSLWLAAMPDHRLPSLAGDTTVDVAVLGGGITGLTTAFLLKRRGARVAVLEARRCGEGVTGNSTAKVTALQSAMYHRIGRGHGWAVAEHYAQASLAAVGTISEIASLAGIDADLHRRSAYSYAASADELPMVESEAMAAARAGLPVQLTDVTDLPFPVAGAVRLDDQLEFHPVRYLRGLVDAVRGDGCAVYEDTPALGVSFRDPPTVDTPHGTVRAEHVVVATHYPLLDRGLFFARLVPQRSYCIAARVAQSPPTGLSINVGSPTRSIRSYGELLIVGGESHQSGAAGPASPERFAALEEFARRHWDVQAVTHRWSAQDPSSYDTLPMIGQYTPVSTRVLVASGFMKWGLTTGTFAAMILADHLSGRANPWWPTFQPNRVSPRSVPSLVRANLKVAADLLGDRLRPAEVASVDDVPPGQARVVGDPGGWQPTKPAEWEKHTDKTGVYREPDGTVHAVSLRCTHLGCLLRFNGAERSWDCPCHGSRFSVDGEVLEGPATRPLAKRSSTTGSR
jgi:glycine/D-amino acid oxidase-like deaminating enzyme/nitrite reductase/ring-hydroxylating ferredoxin subunit